MSLKIIALGTGVCVNGCIPGPFRAPPGFLVDYNGNLLLLEASEGIRMRIEQAGYDYSKIAHLAITHAHPDHAALPQFIQSKLCRALWCGPGPGVSDLTIYMQETFVPGFEQVWAWHQPENGNKSNAFPDKFKFQVQAIRGGWKEEIFSGLTLSAFGVYHGFGQHLALGYRIECKEGIVVYIGDAGLTDSLFVQSEKADLLITDCAARLGQEYTGGYGHMGPKQGGELAYRGQVKELWLTHYEGFDTPQAMEAECRKSGFAGKLKVATDGIVWEAK